MLDGSGRIVVSSSRSLYAEVAGSGKIVYGGHPVHLTTRISGSGSIVYGGTDLAEDGL